MAKTANLYARIEPEVKEQAESILAALGIPVSNAINMFYKQIILQRGIPFEMKLPQAKVVDMGKLTAQELDQELEKGYQDVLAGRTRPANRVFDEIRKDYGIWHIQSRSRLRQNRTCAASLSISPTSCNRSKTLRRSLPDWRKTFAPSTGCRSGIAGMKRSHGIAGAGGLCR